MGIKRGILQYTQSCTLFQELSMQHCRSVINGAKLSYFLFLVQIGNELICIHQG